MYFIFYDNTVQRIFTKITNEKMISMIVWHIYFIYSRSIIFESFVPSLSIHGRLISNHSNPLMSGLGDSFERNGDGNV